MSLPLSTRLGPYEIIVALGVAGMGQVYRARETRLERPVAIKVLPEHPAPNPDLRQRFEREAKAVSSQNHPHICVLDDIGHHDGTDYLVMERVVSGDVAGATAAQPRRRERIAWTLAALLKLSN